MKKMLLMCLKTKQFWNLEIYYLFGCFMHFWSMYLLKNHGVHSSFWPGWPQAAVHLPASDSMGKEGLGIAVCRARVLTLWSWWVSSNSAMVPLLLCGMWTCGWVSLTWQSVREHHTATGCTDQRIFGFHGHSSDTEITSSKLQWH